MFMTLFLQILFEEYQKKKGGCVWIWKLAAVSARKVFCPPRTCLHKAIIVFK